MHTQFSEVELGDWKPSCLAGLVTGSLEPLPLFVWFCHYTGYYNYPFSLQ